MKGFIVRSSVALTIVVAVLFHVIHLTLSILAFYGLWEFLDLLIHNPSGRLEVALTIFGSFWPLASALLGAHILGKRILRSFRVHFLAAPITAYYVISITLLTYRLEAGVALDPFLIWLHFRDAWKTAWILARSQAALVGAGAVVLCLYYAGIATLCRLLASRRNANPSRTLQLSLAASFVAFVFFQWLVSSSLANLVFEFHQPQSEIRILYSSYFQDSIKRNQEQIPVTSNKPQPNLFIFQLESLNAQLVNRKITPQLLEIAGKDGVLFSNIQSSSVFTILAKETLLCSVLPTVERNLSLSRDLFGTLVCLPEIMRRMGYRTMYFQNFPNIDFANADKFLESIGFDERHAADVMKAGDTQIGWGYLEDIYYQRVFEHLERYRGQKIFAYILAGATNHYPFYIEKAQHAAIRSAGGLPHADASGIRQRVENTTFLQDYFFGKAYHELFRRSYGSRSHAIVLGDHSWPIGLHPGNENNLSVDGAYQENFVTSLAILPALENRERWNIQLGKTVTDSRSQLDFLPTILELYGVGGARYYGSSFFKDLVEQTASSERRNCLVSVQPFAGGSIAILQDSMKQIFHLRAGTVKTYDLARDPDERQAITDKIGPDKRRLLDQCLASIKDANAGKNAGKRDNSLASGSRMQ